MRNLIIITLRVPAAKLDEAMGLGELVSLQAVDARKSRARKAPRYKADYPSSRNSKLTWTGKALNPKAGETVQAIHASLTKHGLKKPASRAIFVARVGRILEKRNLKQSEATPMVSDLIRQGYFKVVE